ncbi:MAG TPA: oxidoreductase [Solirubrobacteraceae bacterium]|jgi:NAD(P)-dependent dehydrogenase (short-subunit alcohol dehydrogenase family)|nr:oxidoreductase [Solirubrobacteraceae bacterium]
MAEPSKAVLITGCSSGIGHATALRLVRDGWTVYATARRPDALADLAGAGARTLALDVTDEDSMRAAVAAVEDAEGAVGVLVNNAGYSQSGAVETVPLDSARRQFETNVFGLVRLTQLVLPAMRAQHWGKVVNLSSMGGRLTFPGGGWYHATKHAVEALSDALRFEVKGFGVDVIVIEPGLITTEFGEAAAGALADATGDQDGPYTGFNAAVGALTKGAYEGPMRRLGGPPERVAAAIEKAITARHAPIRVTVTPSAKMMLGTRKLLTDRAWDGAMRRQFPQPG